MRLTSNCFLVSGPEYNQQCFIPCPMLLLLTTVKAGYGVTGIYIRFTFFLCFLHSYVNQTSLSVLMGIILRPDLCFTVQTSCVQTDDEALC